MVDQLEANTKKTSDDKQENEKKEHKGKFSEIKKNLV